MFPCTQESKEVFISTPFKQVGEVQSDRINSSDDLHFDEDGDEETPEKITDDENYATAQATPWPPITNDDDHDELFDA